MPDAAEFDPQSVKGFLSPEEGAALARYGAAGARRGPLLEIGSYCGKSACYLGAAARDAGMRLYSIDHHRGSEEQQPGWTWHDPELWDDEANAMDTLPAFRRTLRAAGLEDHVVALVGPSPAIARDWRTPLGLVFIDGGHTMKAAMADWRGWGPLVAPQGYLAIHDVWPNPDDGGRPPMEIYRRALASGLFDPVARVASLSVLRRVG